jgi:hypothetical protein
MIWEENTTLLKNEGVKYHDCAINGERRGIEVCYSKKMQM